MTTTTPINPYSTPNSNLEMPQPRSHKGGSLESGIAGEYDFTIRAMLSEAWAKTNGLKGPFWGAALLLMVSVLLIAIALSFALGTGGTATRLIVQLAITAFMYPFMAGIFMMGVKRSVNQPISFNMMFSYFSVTGTVILAGFFSTILTWVGFLLLIIPGLYLAIAYGLIIPLIADKKLSAWQAMEASRKAITKRWFKIFGLYLVMGIILIISVIPLGLGLIWTYPMMVALMGILYREIFGVTGA